MIDTSEILWAINNSLKKYSWPGKNINVTYGTWIKEVDEWYYETCIDPHKLDSLEIHLSLFDKPTVEHLDIEIEIYRAYGRKITKKYTMVENLNIYMEIKYELELPSVIYLNRKITTQQFRRFLRDPIEFILEKIKEENRNYTYSSIIDFLNKLKKDVHV